MRSVLFASVSLLSSLPALAAENPPTPFGGLAPFRPAPLVVLPPRRPVPPLVEAQPASSLAEARPAALLAPARLAFKLIAFQEAEKAHVPYDLVDAVMKIESDYRPDQIGGVGEIGLMQVRPETAAMLGFKGTPQDLAVPAVNIHYGATYLGRAWQLTNGNVCRTLMKYNAGHGAESMSAQTAAYCSRARVHLASLNSPLATGITPTDLISAAESEPPQRHGKAAGVADVPALAPSIKNLKGKSFWTVFQARIKKINDRLETKWKRTASR